jgi:hypothetical protein
MTDTIFAAVIGAITVFIVPLIIGYFRLQLRVERQNGQIAVLERQAQEMSQRTTVIERTLSRIEMLERSEKTNMETLSRISESMETIKNALLKNGLID